MDDIKWQPVMLVLAGGRLECKCGALAIFVSGKLAEGESYNSLEDVDCWCQSCYAEAQEKE